MIEIPPGREVRLRGKPWFSRLEASSQRERLTGPYLKGNGIALQDVGDLDGRSVPPVEAHRDGLAAPVEQERGVTNAIAICGSRMLYDASGESYDSKFVNAGPEGGRAPSRVISHEMPAVPTPVENGRRCYG